MNEENQQASEQEGGIVTEQAPVQPAQRPPDIPLSTDAMFEMLGDAKQLIAAAARARREAGQLSDTLSAACYKHLDALNTIAVLGLRIVLPQPLLVGMMETLLFMASGAAEPPKKEE